MELILISILYISLALELILFHVPSVANTHVFFDITKAEQYDKYRRIFFWPFYKKALLLLIPHIINVVLFFAPFFIANHNEYRINIFMQIGFIMAIFGRWITFTSMKKLNSTNQECLIKDKFFKISRNPGVLGMILFFIGVYIIIKSWLGIPIILYYFAYNHFRILIEEDYLHKNQNSNYLEYSKKIPRYV